jgi:hypothetical protein
MRNERVEVTRGTANVFSSYFTLLAVVLAVGLTACGKSSPGPVNPPGTPTLQSLALSPSAVTISTGTAQQFTVTGTYSDNTTKTISSGITWSSSSPIVAKMDGPGSCMSTKDSTALEDRDDADPSIYYGTTTIIASVGGVSAQATVRVNAATLQSISIEPATAEVPLPTGSNAPVISAFTAWGHYSDNTKAPLIGAYTCLPPPAPPCVDWATSNGNAIIDASGFAQAVAGAVAGHVTITATYGTLSSTADLNITPAVLLSAAVVPSTASIPAGFKQQFALIGQYSDGTSQPVPATWASSSGAVTVDVDGLATGVTAGAQPVTITATGGGFSSTAALTVTAAVAVDPIPPQGGSIPAGTISFFKGTGTANAEYLVSLTPANVNLLVEVHADAFFSGAPVCSSWAGGPPCRAGFTSSVGDLFVQVTNTSAVAAPFTLTVSPLPDLSLNQLVAGTNTETYFKITGAVATPFGATLQALTDPFADLFVYNFAQGPGDVGASGLLCSTVALDPANTKSCGGATAPVAVVYGTVEAWLTAAGTDFTATSP